MRRLATTACAVLALALSTGVARAAGPAIDWDPAYAWQAGGTATNLPLGGEFKMVGTISQFGPPLDFLNALLATNEFTFYVHNLISNGTVPIGPPSTTIYTTGYTGGTIEVYQDPAMDAVFAPGPPNAQVPSTFTGGTPILTGNFTSFTVTSNNFTAFDTGNIEGDIQWTGGTLIGKFATSLPAQPCEGLFTGGSTWYPPVLIAGYLFRHDGKIDAQCPTPAQSSTWGRLKTLYR